MQNWSPFSPFLRESDRRHDHLAALYREILCDELLFESTVGLARSLQLAALPHTSTGVEQLAECKAQVLSLLRWRISTGDCASDGTILAIANLVHVEVGLPAIQLPNLI
jgi:hypothetical protein